MTTGLNYDYLTTKLHGWASAEKERASGNADTRQEIGQFIEDHGLNKKGLAMIRRLDKMEQTDRADVLETFDHLREMLEPGWEGQMTLPLDEPIEPVEDAA